MRQQSIAERAGVRQCHVSRYMSGASVPREVAEKIARVLRKSKAQTVLEYLQTGRTLTPNQSLSWFGLHALSQTVTKLRMRGYDIRNIAGRGRDGHQFATYKLFMKESK